MSERAHVRDLRDALAAAERRDSGAARYVLSQRRARRGRAATDRPRPLEFDESGFPIAQRSRSFADGGNLPFADET